MAMVATGVTVRLMAVGFAVLAASCGHREAPPELVEQGKRFFAEGKHVEALASYDRAIALDVNYGPAHFENAEAFAQLGEGRAALAEYVRAADLMPQNALAQVRAGEALLSVRRFKDARTRAEAALTLAPRNLDAQILLGYSLASLRDFNSALVELRSAIALDPSKTRSYGMLADTAAAAGRFDEAESALKSAIEIDPSVPRPVVSLGGLYWSAGRQREAEAQFRKALELDPNDIAANRAIAVLLLAQNRGSEAEPFMLRLADQLKDAEARLELADYYLALGRPADAQRILQELRDVPRTFITARLRLSVIAEQDGRSTEGKAHLSEILEVDPNNARALLIQARLRFGEGDVAGSISSLQAAAAAEPESAAVRLVLGAAYARASRADEALAIFSEAATLDTATAVPYVQTARLLLLRKQSADALAAARRSVELAPADVDARVTLAECLTATGDLTAAERELAPLQRAYPKAADVAAARGRLERAAGRTASARRALEQALQLDSNDPHTARDLVELLVTAKATATADRTALGFRADHPGDVERLALIARVRLAQRDLAGARQSIGQAVAAGPEAAHVQGEWGRLMLEAGHTDDAVRALEAAVRLQPATALFQYDLARAALASGDRTRARAALTRALALSTTFDGSADTRRVLATLP